MRYIHNKFQQMGWDMLGHVLRFRFSASFKMRNVTKPDLQWYNKGMTPPILPNSNAKIYQICMLPFLVITLL